MIAPYDTGLSYQFGRALLEPDLPLPRGVVGPRGKKAEKRFSVYRNNVTVSLINALGDIFPALKTLVGATNFGHIAREFVRACPPGSPLLFEYGHDFPEFIGALEQLRKYTYLPDVARLERAWLDAFHAPDADPLTAESLGAIAPDRLGAVVFDPHPATRLVASDFAIVSIATRSRAGEPIAGIDPANSETALVTRPHAIVELRALPAGGATFFRTLLNGHPLGAAALLAAERDWDFDLAAAIAALLESGAFTTLSIPENTAEGA
ncbi:MAG: DUF2063 domain-containing protein [Rhizobiales bacterium]|nr:DUF2063 domain-containing protein [Hyphomicrobiales bacterium]